MKKVLSIVLSIAMVICLMPSMVFAADDVASTTYSDIDGLTCEDAVVALSALGVVNGYADGTYQPAKTVTRAEMAKLIISELGLAESADGFKSDFTDCKDHWAKGYIGYAASLGIVNGYGYGLFGPDDTVTYDQAYTMIVRAIGYTTDCKEMNGTWPATYVQKAKILGLDEDVAKSGSNEAERGDIAIMLYNALVCEMGYANNDGDFTVRRDANGSAVQIITNLSAAKGVANDGYKVITDADADGSVVNIRKYIGSYAQVFTLTKGADKGEIIAIGDVKSTFLTGKLNNDGDFETTEGVVYTLGDSLREYTLEDKTTTQASVYFGNATEVGGPLMVNYSSDKDKEFTVAADISGKKIKSLYSVNQWVVTDDLQIEEDDLEVIEKSHKLNGYKFEENDDDEIDLEKLELVGVSSLSEIEVDDVVYIYDDGTSERYITRLAVGKEVVEGEATKNSNGADGSVATKITIGGKAYKVANNGNGLTLNQGNWYAAPTSIIGDEVKAYLDAYGRIYDVEKLSGADNFAVVLGRGNDSDGISTTTKMKLFLSDGTFKVMTVDKDISAAAIAVTTGSMIKYSLDKDGVVDGIEATTAAINSANGATSISSKGYIKSKEITEDTVIFSYDGSDLTDEDNYKVVKLADVKDSDVSHYDWILNNARTKLEALIIDGFSGSDDVYGVITGVSKTSGDYKYEINSLVNGETKPFNTDVSTFKKATATSAAISVVNKFTLGSDGQLKSATSAFDYINAGVSGSDELQDVVTYISGAAIVDGYTVKLTTTGSGISVTAAGISTGSGITVTSGTNLEITLDKNVTVYIWDNNAAKFVVGSKSDIRNAADNSMIEFLSINGDDANVFDIVVIHDKC